MLIYSSGQELIYRAKSTSRDDGLYGQRHEKTCLRWFANNNGADQPAHPHSLISALVIHIMESIICKLATSEISVYCLVHVAEETGLKLAALQSPKTGFVPMRSI